MLVLGLGAKGPKGAQHTGLLSNREGHGACPPPRDPPNTSPTQLRCGKGKLTEEAAPSGDVAGVILGQDLVRRGQASGLDRVAGWDLLGEFDQGDVVAERKRPQSRSQELLTTPSPHPEKAAEADPGISILEFAHTTADHGTTMVPTYSLIAWKHGLLGTPTLRTPLPGFLKIQTLVLHLENALQKCFASP